MCIVYVLISIQSVNFDSPVELKFLLYCVDFNINLLQTSLGLSILHLLITVLRFFKDLIGQ